LRICREKAKREKWTITYKDAGISGASMILRPGIQTLLLDAQRQQFDVVLAEALDRISRDQADVATLFKHLRFAGVPIITLAPAQEACSDFSGHASAACPAAGPIILQIIPIRRIQFDLYSRA
jgi:DNA invertase Pin-like site-specific DNA recombinase